MRDKKLKDIYFLIIRTDPVARCFDALLCHYLYETATDYFFRYNGSSTGELHSRTVAPKKNPKKFVFKSVKNANF